MTDARTASQQITDEVTSWPGVTAGPGRRGEFAFTGRPPRDRPPPRRPRRALLLPQGRSGPSSSSRARWRYHPVFPDKPGPGRAPDRGRRRRARRDRAAAAQLPARRHAPRRARRGLSRAQAARARRLSLALAREQALVGEAEQLAGIGRVVRAPRPRRTSRAPTGRRRGSGRRRSRRSRASTMRSHAGAGGPGATTRELVAADARQAVAVADHARARLGHGAQDGVAGRVAVVVVDRLEAVEVEEHERGRAAVLGRARQRVVEAAAGCRGPSAGRARPCRAGRPRPAAGGA